MNIKTTTYPRAALIGNPSDGYFGKTIAFPFGNFSATVELSESSDLKIVPCERERTMFASVNELVHEINEHGYYGGVRLVKATIKQFYDYCAMQNIKLTQQNFAINYQSNIPPRLGLAGSSAIVVGVLKSLAKFYEVEIPKPITANLALAAEKEELGIGAGLQDRVVQVYNTPVFMNFNEAIMQQQGFGEYIPFDKNLLPNIYIAFRRSLSEGSEVSHNTFANRFKERNTDVLQAVQEWIQLADGTWSRLQQGNKQIDDLINRNFDVRKRVMNISKGNEALVETARSCGVSAKFTGSGGAVIGCFENEETLTTLTDAMKKIEAEVIIPEIL